MRTVDCSYTISEERIRAYLEIPEIERLRWLDELVRFTLMWRAAPEAKLPDPSPQPSVRTRGEGQP
jgi:hypothetical protein